MARLQLNKSSLARESHNLKTYQRFLPSLDLKRQQLMAERAKARRQLSELQEQQAHLSRYVSNQLPMMANDEVELTNLVRLQQVQIEQENVVGTRLPRLENLVIETKPYNFLAKPHWVDLVCKKLVEAIELSVQIELQEQRISILNKAVMTITQRVNLFDKVLIPKAQDNIKRIRIYLSDEQMVSVVRSKIAKNKRAMIRGDQ